LDVIIGTAGSAGGAGNAADVGELRVMQRRQ
jgi:hypothetical protein